MRHRSQFAGKLFNKMKVEIDPETRRPPIEPHPGFSSQDHRADELRHVHDPKQGTVVVEESQEIRLPLGSYRLPTQCLLLVQVHPACRSLISTIIGWF